MDKMGGGSGKVPEDGGGAQRKKKVKLPKGPIIDIFSFLDDKSTSKAAQVSRSYLAAGKVASNIRKDNLLQHIHQLKDLLVNVGAGNRANDLNAAIDDITNHPKSIFLEKDVAVWKQVVADSLLVLEPEERAKLFTMVDVHNNDTFRYLLSPDEVIAEKLKDKPWAEGLGAVLAEYANDDHRKEVALTKIIYANPELSADDLELICSLIPNIGKHYHTVILLKDHILPKLLKENRADIIASMIKTTSEGAKFLLQIASHVLSREDSLITNLCAYHNIPRDENLNGIVSLLESHME